MNLELVAKRLEVAMNVGVAIKAGEYSRVVEVIGDKIVIAGVLDDRVFLDVFSFEGAIDKLEDYEGPVRKVTLGPRL